MRIRHARPRTFPRYYYMSGKLLKAAVRRENFWNRLGSCAHVQLSVYKYSEEYITYNTLWHEENLTSYHKHASVEMLRRRLHVSIDRDGVKLGVFWQFIPEL